ncbi:MAG: hypothetical protein VB141_11415 [Burkholderia gladioli]
MSTKPALKVVAANDNVVTVAPARRVDMRGFLRSGGHAAASTGKGIFTVLRYAVFYVLMWLRILVHFVTTGCATLGLFGLVLAGILKPEWSLMCKIGTFSFSMFLIGWLYDGLLLAIAPAPMMLDGRMTQ